MTGSRYDGKWLILAAYQRQAIGNRQLVQATANVASSPTRTHQGPHHRIGKDHQMKTGHTLSHRPTPPNLTAILSVALCLAYLPSHSSAAMVTVGFTGQITTIDAALSTGPFSVGQTVSGSYTYENDPALNPDFNASATVGQFAATPSATLQVGGDNLAMSPGIGLVLFDGTPGVSTDGWSPSFSLTGPAIGSFNATAFDVFLRDTDSTVFASDDLPLQPPALSEFEITSLIIFYEFGSNQARITASVLTHQVIPSPVTAWLLAPAIVGWLASRRHKP